MFEVIDLTGQTFFGLGTQFDPLLNCPPVGDAEWTGFSAPTEAILLSCIAWLTALDRVLRAPAAATYSTLWASSSPEGRGRHRSPQV